MSRLTKRVVVTGINKNHNSSVTLKHHHIIVVNSVFNFTYHDTVVQNGTYHTYIYIICCILHAVHIDRVLIKIERLKASNIPSNHQCLNPPQR